MSADRSLVKRLVQQPEKGGGTDPRAEAVYGGWQVAELTGAIARGDHTAFGTFYEAWFDRAYSLARLISKRDEAFCLDVVQDSMLKIIRSIRRLEDERSLARWVARVVHTTTIDSLRREARRKHHESRAVAGRRGDDFGHDAESHLELEERIRWLESRLAELPGEDRTLLFQRFGLGKTLAAVGAAVGLTGNTVQGRIRRVLARLREAAGRGFREVL